MKRTLVLPAALLAASTVLAACGSDGSTTSGGTSGMDHASASHSATASPGASAAGTPATGAHNDDDVEFATSMIDHHRQAVRMAQMATGQAGSQDVKDLAARVEAGQGPEIEQMGGWLTGWDEPVPAEGAATAGHDMSTMGGAPSHTTASPTTSTAAESVTGSPAGSMTSEDMAELAAASGNEFDRMWLTMMTQHHSGAVEMAQGELSDGQNPDAKALAQTIIDTQNAEIAEMQQILAGLPAA